MALAILQRRLHHPDAVQLPADGVGVQVMGSQQRLGVAGGEHLVGVVGDVHLLLAHQLPVEAVETTVEHVQLIEAHDAGGGRGRRVAAGVGQATHTALARQVGPDRSFVGVEVLKAGNGLPGTQGRAVVGHADGPEHTLVATATGQVPGHLQIGPRVIGEHVLAVGGGQVLIEAGVPGRTPPTQQVVPHGFHAIGRDRERDAAGCAFGHGAGGAVHQLAAGGVGEGGVVHRLRSGSAAACRVDVETIAVRVLLQHGLDARRQLVGILRHVLRGDAQQPLVAGERIATLAAFLIGRVGLDVATGPGRNAAIRIAGPLATERGQAGLEHGRLLGGHCGNGAVGQ
ncbi:hypothetical protein D3C80_1044100 [compost metagenome]